MGGSLLGGKPDGRIKIIQQRVQIPVHFSKGVKRVLTSKTGIPNGFSHGIAVFPVRAASGKRDAVPGAPVKELAVDEFVAVAAAGHGERRGIPDSDDLFLDPAAGVIGQGALQAAILHLSIGLIILDYKADK